MNTPLIPLIPYSRKKHLQPIPLPAKIPRKDCHAHPTQVFHNTHHRQPPRFPQVPITTPRTHRKFPLNSLHIHKARLFHKPPHFLSSDACVTAARKHTGMEELVPLYDLAVGREGIVIAKGGQVEFLRLHPAAGPEVLVGLAEVVRPGADCEAGADTAVD